ncbi:MAG TPA: bifunctional precorrin-2 dehydrogenase/sirohydrochlorin ferrochelatase [Acidimicrobiales bacterium]|jgi:precorrin-2 dehydrogenase/sirohydrochlorin ferrochelatase|nr:bifunctional precorrin-2 dehydrogenase/sirohydrochlorin ferrochelatase [Acidimicrobiales bacterium]
MVDLDTAYPVNLLVAGRPCLVVGGGTVAARKVEGLLACDASVRVVSPVVDDEIRGWPEVTVDQRPYRRGDVDGQRLVISATDSSEVNRAVYLDCEAAGVWVCGADDPDNCSFTLPSVVRRGTLVVTVATGGRSPAVARWLRERLEAQIGPEYEVLLDLVADQRAAVKAEGRSPSQLDWQKALDSDMLDLIRTGDLESARKRLETCLSLS